jgi:nucleoid-associated protein YgaU
MAEKMQFWLSIDNNRDRIQLPVNPPEIRVNAGYMWTDVNINQLGDYSLPAGHSLTEISLTSFFPRDYNPSYCEYENIPDPWSLVKKLGEWKESKKPIRLIVTGTNGRINYAMTIRKFEFWEQAGSPGDVYFTLDLKEYRFIKLTPVGPTVSKQTGLKTVIKASPKPPRPNEKTLPKTYTVKPGDNLTKIAQRMRTLGHKNIDAHKLYAANKKIIGKNMNLIKPGQVLTIPK